MVLMMMADHSGRETHANIDIFRYKKTLLYSTEIISPYASNNN